MSQERNRRAPSGDSLSLFDSSTPTLGGCPHSELHPSVTEIGENFKFAAVRNGRQEKLWYGLFPLVTPRFARSSDR